MSYQWLLLLLTVYSAVPIDAHNYIQHEVLRVRRQQPQNLCESGELHSDPNDCTHFQRCMETTGESEIVSFPCPENTIFQYSLGYCIPEDPEEPCQPRDSRSLRIFPRATEECTQLGKMSCANCNMFQLCTNDGLGQQVNQKYNCSAGTYCNNSTGSCQQNVPECESFQCVEEGTFPDTESCVKYHKCDKDMKVTTLICPSDQSYNAASLTCDKPVDGSTCFNPISKCDETASSVTKFAVKDSCMLYYTCEPSKENDTLKVPVYHKCLDGLTFAASSGSQGECDKLVEDVTDESCLLQLRNSGKVCFQNGPNVKPGNACPTKAYECMPSTNGLIAYINTTCPENQAYNLNEATCQNFSEMEGCTKLCSSEGNKENLDNCTTFFRCATANNPPVLETCPSNTAFNKDKESCDYFENVPYCKITDSAGTSISPPTASSSTSTSSLTTTATSTTTTSSATTTPTTTSSTTTTTPTTTTSTTTTTTTTTAKTTTAAPFRCDKQGMFQVSGNCLQYILCRNNGNGFIQEVRNCPSNYMFNSQLRYCVLRRGSNC